eukprot:CAMPEP_0198133428 /NCGR_PEP_ID=MMETSP1442-20131203/59556_1 /TAXON_ID= /ORGANISM="Craspedostauros australis, Strain CCMP3328" /LENGTH=228 /DNA_ID=CAMNT_0043794545 /DNA_START=270 /DNA_END=956 /DNA_ORIENTATION=-
MDAQLQSTAASLCPKFATALCLAPQEAWMAYNDALEASPLLVKSITASVILGAADVAGQALESRYANNSDDDTVVQSNSESASSGIDLARTARFAFFGLVLQAPWNHFYYLFLDGALPPTAEPFTPTTGIKVVIDQFVQAPIFTVLIFGFLGFLEGKSLDAIKQQLGDDYADTMVANWKLWVPATVVNIAFVPPILRVLYLNCVFFFWSIFLSIKLNGSTAGEEEASP